MKVKKIVSIILIAAGLLLTGYPVTLIVQSRIEQNKLKKLFKEEIIANEENRDKVKAKEETPRYNSWPNAILKISKISLEVAVVQMREINDFERKITQVPSHYSQTALPGEAGNIAIAGHVNGPAGYFKNLKKLSKGDEIILNTPKASYRYIVERVFITENNDWSVIAPTSYSALTLTTCERVGSNTSAKRLIVRARLTETVLQ